MRSRSVPATPLAAQGAKRSTAPPELAVQQRGVGEAFSRHAHGDRTVAIVRHINHKQDVAWCHDHGYANYATTDGFCVGTGGRLIKVDL